MALIADFLLAAGALGAAFYCLVLSRRLNKFNNLQGGMGGAVATLSVQVDDLEKTLEAARATAQISADQLQQLTQRAEDVRRQLEMQMAALHDVVPSQPQHVSEADELTPQAEAEPSTEGQETSQLVFSRRRSG